VSEVEDRDDVVDYDARESFWRGRKVRFTNFRWEWKGEGEGEEGQFRDWEPIRVLKTRLREFEQKNSSSEIFENFKNSEFVEKVKSSLVCYFFIA